MSDSTSSTQSDRYRSPSPSSSSASTSSRDSSETGHTSIRDGHVPSEISLAVFDKTLLHAEKIGSLAGLASEQYETFIQDLAGSSDLVYNTMNLLNALSDIYARCRQISGDARIEFIPHSHAPLLHHPRKSTLLHHPRKSTVAQPPLIAVSSRVAQSWRTSGESHNLTTPSLVSWHHVQAAVYVKDATNDRHPIDHCATFLGALNQARPDLPGSFSLTATRQSFRFLWSDAADVYASHPASSTDNATLHTLFRFIHRLHVPRAVDSTITLEHAAFTTTVDTEDIDTMGQPDVHTIFQHRDLPRKSVPAKHVDRPYDTAAYTAFEISSMPHEFSFATTDSPIHELPPVWLVADDKGVQHRITAVLAVGRPWTHRNWVAIATQCRARGSTDFTDCPRTVVKDSWNAVDCADISESAVLQHIHADGEVPGVCSVLSSFQVPGQNNADGLRTAKIPDAKVEVRRKHRLILDGTGKDLYSCRSVLEFLKVMYDTLEVLRYLHGHRHILHRDISIRNILLAGRCTPDKRDGALMFIDDLLKHKYSKLHANPGPYCTLIDFDNAHWFDKMSESSLRLPAGTPAFIARSVAHAYNLGTSVPPDPIPELMGSAKECYVRAYGEGHYSAQSTLHDTDEIYRGRGVVPLERQVHAPRHDVESCVWVIVHFLATALPAGADPGDDDTGKGDHLCHLIESYRIGAIGDMRAPVLGIARSDWPPCLHRDLRSFGNVVFELAEVVQPIYERFKTEFPPYHLHEAVQRILLNEICRILDQDADVALDVHRRRALTSVHITSPLWSLPEYAAPALPVNKKRRAQPLTQPDSSSRRRLS